MAEVEVGKKVPAFKVASTGGATIAGKDLLGSPYVLYFYPKDDTPGCTMEGHDFRDHFADFKRHDVRLFGVSRDSVASHEKFKAKHGFPFDLLSDPDEILCRLFDVIKQKNMYGKKALGIERSTFLIDPKGVLRNEWRKVKVNGHVAAVLAAAETL
jgi:peroxiredoxin Q/BCP